MMEKTELLEQILHDYHCQFTLEDDENGLSLVDVLTPPGDRDITRGKEEITLLADYILSELADRTPPPLTDELLSKATVIKFRSGFDSIWKDGDTYSASRRAETSTLCEIKNGFATVEEAFAWIQEGRENGK